MEDVAEQTMNHLAVIHRFMATHPSLVNRGSTDTLGPPPPTFQAGGNRLRTMSDRSEVSGHLHLDVIVKQIRFSVQNRPINTWGLKLLLNCISHGICSNKFLSKYLICIIFNLRKHVSLIIYFCFTNGICVFLCKMLIDFLVTN